MGELDVSDAHHCHVVGNAPSEVKQLQKDRRGPDLAAYDEAVEHALRLQQTISWTATDGAAGQPWVTRGQETELPQALKWQIARADEDYDAALVEARRITVDTTRIASESFPMAVPPEEAERRCRRALMEAWVGRETAAFRLPPSRLALDPADAIRLQHDGLLIDLRLVSIADAEARGIGRLLRRRSHVLLGLQDRLSGERRIR
jgi:hypothetical protein